ncbi:MAG TPA: transposase, partial [Myxococcales bacterium]|nr:transposase [Myxococcales bacterium]
MRRRSLGVQRGIPARAQARSSVWPNLVRGRKSRPSRPWACSSAKSSSSRCQLATIGTLRQRVARFDPRTCAIFSLQRRRARRAGARAPRIGAVTFVQRFGGALNLNVHFHCVIPDGVFVRDAEGTRFLALPGPSDDDVQEVLRHIVRRLRKLLRPRLDAAQADARAPDALVAAQADSLSVLRGNSPHAVRIKRQAAYLEGFSLHAGVHLHANDREGLAHLCGYGARPPLAQNRLSHLPDGRIAYRLKRPLATGGEVLILEPCELLRRLAALVPPRRSHLVRYHGVFGPASAWRSQIIPWPEKSTPRPCPPAVTAPPPSEITARQHTSRIPWAELLLRVFREDVLVCPCGGRRVVLAFVT